MPKASCEAKHTHRRLARMLACVLGCMVLPAGAGEPGAKVVAYVQGGSLPARIDAEKLTHINYAFARIAAGRVVLDRPGAARDLANLRALKRQNPHLLVMVSIGGW